MGRQPGWDLFASLPTALPASSCTTQASVILCSPHSSWHGDGLSGAGGRYLQATVCDHLAQFAFLPGTLTSSYLESSAYPHWEKCRGGSSYCLGIECPSTFAIGSRSKTRKEKNQLISESQLSPHLQIQARVRTSLSCTFRTHFPVNFSPNPPGKLMLGSHSYHLFLRPLPSVTQHILIDS